MKLTEKPFKEIDLAKVSEMILEARQSTEAWPPDMKQDRVEEIMTRNFESLNVSVISAIEDSNIQGVILLKVNEDRTADINPWFLGGLPLISPKVGEADELASVLLEQVIESAKIQGVTLLFSMFRQEMHTKSSKKLLENHKMSIIEELDHLQSSLSDLRIPDVKIPDEMRVVKLSGFDRESLFDCWYEAFINGEDRHFLNRSDDERRGHFEENFDLSEDIIDDASLVVLSESEPAAFVLVKPTHGRGNAHVWEIGVHPDYRRRGLAKSLLRLVHENLTSEDYETMSMNVDTSNRPAYKLYTSLGFKRERGFVGYGRRINE
jgi:ribosomal protein S18 acetylase RimI-like enzyme